MIRLVRGPAILTITIPRLERQVTTEALRTPTARGVSPEAFGAGLAQGVGRLASDMQQNLRAARERADRTAVLNGRTALDTKEQELTWGTEETPGFLRLGGKEVFEIDAPTLTEFDRFAAEEAMKLQEGEQREAFAALAAQRRNALNLNLQRHINGEVKKFTKAANDSALASTANNIAQFYNDPDRIEKEITFGLGVIESDPDNSELPRSVVDQRRQEFQSKAHRTVVERLMVDNPRQAQEYLERFGTGKDPVMSQADVVALQKQLKPLSEAQEGSEISASIFAEGGESSLLEMLEKAKSSSDNPGVVKAAQAEIRTLYAAREEEKKQAISEAEGTIYATIAKIKLDGGIPTRNSVSRADWARLSALDPKAVDRIADELSRGQEHAEERTRARENRADSRATNEQLTTWGLLKTNPQTLKETNLDVLLTQEKLNASLYKDLITDQQDMASGKGEKEAKLLSNKTAVDTVLRGVGITQTKNPENYAKFYEEMQKRVSVLVKPSQDEITKIARSLLTEVSQDKDWWPIDKDVPAFLADPAKVRVPGPDRVAIEAVLRKKNMPVTEEAIRQIYLENKKRGN